MIFIDLETYFKPLDGHETLNVNLRIKCPRYYCVKYPNNTLNKFLSEVNLSDSKQDFRRQEVGILTDVTEAPSSSSAPCGQNTILNKRASCIN